MSPVPADQQDVAVAVLDAVPPPPAVRAFFRMRVPDANVEPAFVVDAVNEAKVPAPKAVPVKETSRMAKRIFRAVLTVHRIGHIGLAPNPQIGLLVVGSAARDVTSHLGPREESSQHERARRSLRA